LNWSEFVALAERHRVAALVYAALRKSEVLLPPSFEPALQGLSRQEALKELALAGEVVRLVKALSEAGVDPFLLKGVSIALQGYRRLGLRTNRDIDLLVETGELATSEAVLTRLGYKRLEPAGSLTTNVLHQWTVLHKDMVYFNAGADSIVEIHWRLFDNPNLMPPIGQGAPERLSYGGCSLRILPRDYNIIYLCLHGMQHAWSRMKWLADLGAMLSGLSQDEVAAVHSQAAAWGLGAPVAASLALCGRILHSPVPASVNRATARSWRAKALEAVAISSLTTGGAVEMEDRNFGSTWKNASHYLFRFNLAYLTSELKYDLLDDPQEPSSGRLSQLILRIPRWIIRQSHRGAASRRFNR